MALYDGRTRDGKAYRQAYALAFTGKTIPSTARLLKTWYAFEEGFAQGTVDRAKADRTSRELGLTTTP